MLTASILGLAALEVDKLFATQSDKFLKNGEFHEIVYKSLAANNNNNLSTSRTAKHHSMLLVKKSLAQLIEF